MSPQGCKQCVSKCFYKFIFFDQSRVSGRTVSESHRLFDIPVVSLLFQITMVKGTRRMSVPTTCTKITNLNILTQIGHRSCKNNNEETTLLLHKMCVLYAY